MSAISTARAEIARIKNTLKLHEQSYSNSPHKLDYELMIILKENLEKLEALLSDYYETRERIEK